MAHLDEQARCKAFGFQVGAAPEGVSIAIQAWNLLGGLDWQGLPVVAEMLGVEDVELLIHQLTAIRDAQNRDNAAPAR